MIENKHKTAQQQQQQQHSNKISLYFKIEVKYELNAYKHTGPKRKSIHNNVKNITSYG